MASINRTLIANQLLPGLNAILGISYKDVPEEHKPFYEIENSERAFEEEQMFTLFGNAPIKPEGSAVQYDTARESWKARYEHNTVALAFAITEEALEDNLYETNSKLQAKGLGRSMANSKQLSAASPFNNGFSSSYTGGDGVALFSASHPTVGAGNQSNLLTAADLSESALESAVISIQLMQDDRGILIGALPVCLGISPYDQFNAHRILFSDLRVGTADNDANALNDKGMLRTIYVNRRFTDNDAWFVKTDVPNGTKMFIRRPLESKMEQDFDTGNMRYKARERYSFGWSDWRGWMGNQGV